jgi:hypothetical protein
MAEKHGDRVEDIAKDPRQGQNADRAACLKARLLELVFDLPPDRGRRSIAVIACVEAVEVEAVKREKAKLSVQRIELVEIEKHMEH